MPEKLRVSPFFPTGQHADFRTRKQKRLSLLGWGNSFHTLLGFQGPQMAIRGKCRLRSSSDNLDRALLKFPSTRILLWSWVHSGDLRDLFYVPIPSISQQSCLGSRALQLFQLLCILQCSLPLYPQEFFIES